jgi:hypothetical protein
MRDSQCERMNLKTRVERLERQLLVRRRWLELDEEIARRQQEGRKRVADWRRSEREAEHAA